MATFGFCILPAMFFSLFFVAWTRVVDPVYHLSRIRFFGWAGSGLTRDNIDKSILFLGLHRLDPILKIRSDSDPDLKSLYNKTILSIFIDQSHLY